MLEASVLPLATGAEALALWGLATIFFDGRPGGKPATGRPGAGVVHIGDKGCG